MNTTRHTFATAFLLASICAPAFAGEASSEPAATPDDATYYNAPGLDMAADPQAIDQYLFVAGSAFHPRSSSQSVTYISGGCIGSSDYVTTDLQIPDGSTVHGIRTYYYNLGLPSGLRTWLTYYDGAGGTTDTLADLSTGDTGYNSEYFSYFPGPDLVTDSSNNAYTLIASIPPGMRLCGMRVFFDTP